MLAVLKKRWKPKRAGNNINNNNGRRSVKSIIIEPTTQLDSEKFRVSTSPRQVHPVAEKVNMGPAPNICVQGGRIEFIKPSQERSDPIKERLEARIVELEALLEDEKKSTLKERRNTARYQALLQERECLAKDVTEAREAKEEALQRLAQARQQAEGTNRRLNTLQETIDRLEQSLLAMSVYKTQYCQLLVENEALKKTIEGKVKQFQSTLSKLNRENENLKTQLHTLESVGSREEIMSERLRLTEEENSRLLAEREKCEKCLDQVAHQVVQALLSQKGLREEIASLREKVKELEKQNYTLSSLLLYQIPKNQQSKHLNGSATALCTRPVSCDEGKLKLKADSLFWIPVHRPCSLNLESQRSFLTGSGGILIGTECHKDEGYSTMSSEAQGEGGGTETSIVHQEGPLLERLQEESCSNGRTREEDVLCGLKVTRHTLIPRSSSDSALLPYSGAGDEQEWWDHDSTLSRIEFDAPPELEEWNMEDIPGLSFLSEDMEDAWFSLVEGQYGLISPGADSWSSQTTTSEGSKRSSGAESETNPSVGTQFTRDFYRLVKFESTKSLASTSSRSQVSESSKDTLQNVLQFIAEQQQYIEEPSGEVETHCPEGSSDSLQNTDSGVVSNLSSSEEVVVKTSESRGLLTVPEEAEDFETSLMTQAATLADLHRLVKASSDDESSSIEPPTSFDSTSSSKTDRSRPTGWVHLNRPNDLNDPKMRINLLDVMATSRSSSSCSGSSESSDDHSAYNHLHRLHRSRRHKKASATRDGALRVHLTPRVSILGREDMFTRFGTKEQEAVASFDFLDEITTSSRESTGSRPSPQ